MGISQMESCCEQALNFDRKEVGQLKAAPVPIRWHSGLPIYASEAFLKSVGSEYGWIGGSDQTEKLRCILPYTVIRKAGIRLVRFRVETIPLGADLDLGEEKSFLNSTMEYFRSMGADMIIPSNNTAIFRTYPDCAQAAPYGTFVNDLTQSEEILFSKVRKTYRNNIRRAMKAGVQIKTGMEYLDVSYQLVADTLKRSGADVIKGYDDFKRSLLSLGENVKILVAEHEGVVQGCLISPYSQYGAYNWYAGSKPEPVLGSVHLLHWEAILQFRMMGVERFNFQGVRINPTAASKQEGILNYKKGFGGVMVQGFMWKYGFRPLKFAAYSIAMRLLKGGDIVDQEHHKLAHS
jgi:Acetyltransferase (GNAT) domain